MPADVGEAGIVRRGRQLGPEERPVLGAEVVGSPAVPRLAHEELVQPVAAPLVCSVPGSDAILKAELT